MKYLRDQRIIKGTLQEQRLRCGNMGCRCHKKGGVGHGPYVYLAAMIGGKTRSTLLKKGDIPVARDYVKRYMALRSEIEEMTRQNIARLRAGKLK